MTPLALVMNLVLLFLNGCFVRSLWEERGGAGMVVTADERASEIGVEILRRGGNAIDAAVAVSFALGVVEPASSGLGGGGFLVLYDAQQGSVRALDFRERAPSGTRFEFYEGEGGEKRLERGPFSIGVPGMVRGLLEAHASYGSRPLGELLSPAEELARLGFRVSNRLSRKIETAEPLLRGDPEAAHIFLKEGEPYQEGEILKQTDLARTIREIIHKGAKGFYHGRVAKAIVEAVNREEELITLDDLQQYRPVWQEPISGEFRGRTLYGIGMPSSGTILLLEALGTVERLSKDWWEGGSSSGWERLVKILGLTYCDRENLLGWETPPSRVERLLDPRTLQERAESVQQSPSYDCEIEDDPFGSTTHFSIVDPFGNAVAVTQTLNYGFGSGVVAPGTGVLLNNELNDFSLDPESPNRIAAGKVPLSSMTPTLVFKEGELEMVLGSPGGRTIPASVFLTLWRRIDLDYKGCRSVGEGRIFPADPNGPVWVEPRFSEEMRKELARSGLPLKESGEFGNLQAIFRENGRWLGCPDPRGEGRAAGL